MSALDLYTRNSELSAPLFSLEEQITQLVRAQVDALEGYSEHEKRALTVFEELKMVNSVDLWAIIFRGRRLKQIREEGLQAFHPAEEYRGRSLKALAKDQGVSESELHNIEDLYNVIFPAMIEFYQGDPEWTLEGWWRDIGKSNMREIIPVLKALITGETGTDSVRTTVENLIAETMSLHEDMGHVDEQGEVDVPDEQIVSETIDTLMRQAETLTNRSLRSYLRPSPMDDIHGTLLNGGDENLLLLTLDDRQLRYIRDRLSADWNIIATDTRNPEAAVQIANAPELTRLRRLLGG